MYTQLLPHAHTIATSSLLPEVTVQGEWDDTLRRLRAHCTVQYATERVDRRRYPTVNLRNTPGLDVAQLERILFENRLLAPLYRLEYSHTIVFQCEWLWQWRLAVPWCVDGGERRLGLAPDDPKHMYTYRFNVEYTSRNGS